MRLRRDTSRRRPDNELTPLINVVFLLLIFVVLAGEVVETAPFRVAPPEVPPTAGVSAETTLFLGAAGQIAVRGQEFRPGDYGGVVAALGRLSPSEVVIEADRSVPASRAIALLAALRDADMPQVRLVTAADGP